MKIHYLILVLVLNLGVNTLLAGPNEDLINAVWADNMSDVRTALDRGANMLEAVDAMKKSLALHLAAHEGRLAIVKLLVEESMRKDPSGESLKKMLNTQNRSKSAPFMTSIKNNHPEVTEYFLQDPNIVNKIDINLYNEEGFTAFIYAVESNNLALVKELLQKFPNIDIAVFNDDKQEQKDALAYAVGKNNLEMVRELLKHKDKLGNQNLMNAVRVAKQKGYNDIMGEIKANCPQCKD